MSPFPSNLSSLIDRQLPPRLARLLKSAGELADRHGWKAYAVGGTVRDLLLGATNFDLDILVEKHGIEFAREWARKQKGIVKLYRRFATALVVLPGGIKVDITTTRSEKYPRPGSLPEVLPGSLEEDLLRRDFTINTLACHLNRASFGRLIDICGGRRDLEEGIIRVLHPRSFQDDPTRIFRAVRFQQRLGFSIESRTRKWMKSAVSLKMFEKVTPERLRRELELILEEKRPSRAVEAMARYDELRFIHPHLFFTPAQKQNLRRLEKDRLWFTDSFPEEKISTWRLYFTALIWPLSVDELKETGRRFNFSRKLLAQMVKARREEGELTRRLSDQAGLAPSEIFRLLDGRGVEIVLVILSRSGSKRIRERIKKYLGEYRVVGTDIGGADLKALGLRPGPRFRQILEQVNFARLDGRVNSRQAELELVRSLIDKPPEGC